MRRAVKDGSEIVVNIKDIAHGRFLTRDVVKSSNGSTIAVAGTLITDEISSLILDEKIDEVYTRSIYGCKAGHGVCQKCYGVDLSSNKLVNIGTAVGIISAQSIGEPGTQLTMRTFHTGGVDLRESSR